MSARVDFDAVGYARLTFSYHPWIVEQIKERIDASARVYDPSTKRWTIAPSWASIAIGILKTVFGDEVEVAYGRTNYSDPPPVRYDRDYAELHLLPSAPPELVQAAYRALALLTHPDRGGNTRAMQQVNAAYEALQKRGAA